jgi:hypothetical protein
MTHFAQLDENNIVIAVYPGRQEDEGKEQELSERTGDKYRQTSYNTYGGAHHLGGTPFRKNFAGIGYRYDETLDAFIPPSPFPSWTLNTETCLWDPPVPRPTGLNITSTWDEENQRWIVVDHSINNTTIAVLGDD